MGPAGTGLCRPQLHHPLRGYPPNSQLPDANSQLPTPNPRRDPLGWLAEAAGYSDGERWWEQMVEQRQDSVDLFAAILEAMTVLRQSVPVQDDQREAQREAFMRQTIRAASTTAGITPLVTRYILS